MHPDSRRSLLLGMAALASQARGQTVKLPRKLRLGMIGFDGHPEEVLRPLRNFPDVELVAVADAASDAAALKAQLRNPLVARAKRYRDYPEMLAQEQLDCVGICNHNGGRAAAILACAARKLNLIAEKPFAINRRDWDAVKAAVSGSGIHAGMLLPMRFEPHFHAMKQVVDSGEIGEVAQIDSQKSYQEDVRPEWQKNTRTYGSTILWIGIHMIDLMSYTSGRTFSQVMSLQGHVAFPELRDMQNVTASVFRLDNGGTATLRMDYLRPASVPGHGDDRLRLAGTRGIVEYRQDSGVTVMAAGGQRILKDLPPAGSVFADFLRSTYLGARPVVTWPEIVRANEATLAAHEAAESGKSVSVRS
jgi:predicted dehydrogenase